MGWTLSAVTVVVFGSGLIALAVGLLVLRERPDPMVGPLAVFMFAVAAWAIPHAIALGVSDPESVAFWHRVRYPGTVTAPVAYLVVALRYAGRERWLSKRTYAALGVIPAVTVVAVWTTPHHDLFWRSISVASVYGASVLLPEFGPLYWVDLGYLYLITIVSLFVLGSVFVRSGPVYRKQAGLMFVGGLAPLVTNGVITFGAGGDPMIDFTTTALAVTGISFALALFYLDLLDVRPVARDRLLEELDDGVVVVGPDGRIRDFNPTAERVLGDIAIDQDAEEVLPSEVAPDGGELVVETGEGKRRFRTRSTRLRDRRGRKAGRIVYLNDVTGLVEREQRISVLNRILRHNVRNELNVASGHLGLLEAEVAEPNREHVENARESVRRVVEFAEKARDIQRTLTESDRSVAVAVVPVLERVVEAAREEFPGAEIGIETPAEAGIEAMVVDGDLFERAIEELIENAVVHSDRETPGVVVRARPDPDGVQVSVADDGPGIPEDETAVLTAGRETQLEHASGLGLWLAHWTASLSGGELSVDENEPRGSVVTLSLPAADQPA